MLRVAEWDRWIRYGRDRDGDVAILEDGARRGRIVRPFAGSSGRQVLQT